MVLLDLIQFRVPGIRVGPNWQSRVNAWGAWIALPLGIVLALGFCPVSATIFFVDLLTISAGGGSHVVYPAVYALGAALPVLVFAALLDAGSRWLGSLLNRMQQVQRWLNLAAGGVLLAVGIYYALRFNFGILHTLSFFMASGMGDSFTRPALLLPLRPHLALHIERAYV